MGKLYHLRDYIFEKDHPDGKALILDTVVRQDVADAVKEAGFDPVQFVVNEQSLKDYFNGPIINSEMDDTTIAPYYDYITDDTLHRVETRLNWTDPEHPDEFTVDTLLLRLRDYKNGNREWEAFNYTSKEWTIGPGEDFFTVDEFEV